jgi:uncharacterized protein (DUF305 family)
MKNQSILFLVIGLIAGSLLTLMVTTGTVNNNNYGMMQMMGIRRDGDTSLNTSAIDKHFIEQMIPHHEGAIDMAKLAQVRSKNTKILNLADAIINSQSEEITQMKGWYKDWYKAEVPVDSTAGMGMGRGMMQGGMMGGRTADITSLENATNFDTAFLQEMIPHHQMAVMMAQMLLSGTNRSEMKTLGQNIITAQEKEIDQMRSWLEEGSL